MRHPNQVAQLALPLFLLLQMAPNAGAHFNMLFPESASVKRGQTVAIVYRWGHPFEHQLFDAPAPRSITVIGPRGTRTELASKLQEDAESTVDAKKAVVHRLSFRPEQRGDYIFSMRCAPIWMEEDQEFLEDTARVTIHVQAQKGWDTAIGEGFELVPLTRPYGLVPGTVFQARAVIDGKPLADAMTEIERYNPVPPKTLPADEHITRTVKSDPNGTITCSLPQPGWWSVTSQRQSGQRDHKGKMYPIRQRATFWVFVDDVK